MAELINEDKVIDVFAEELARLQKDADKWYYIRRDQNMSSYVLNLVTELKELANKLGITKKVYDRAYQIYDFRNSGKDGYVPDWVKEELKGKIIEDVQ